MGRCETHKQWAYLKQEELHFISFDFDDPDKLREQLLLFKQQEGGFDYIVHCAGVTKCVHQSDFDRVNYWQNQVVCWFALWTANGS